MSRKRTDPEKSYIEFFNKIPGREICELLKEIESMGKELAPIFQSKRMKFEKTKLVHPREVFTAAHPAHPTHRRFQQLTRRLNASLKELLYYREVGFGLQLGRWWIEERWQQRRPDYLAIEYILGLLKDGRLDRLRQCDMCLKWFVAWQTSQTTCGERCRRQHYKTDPKFRMKRAKYMREEYRPRFPSRRGRSSHA
jgi:hypothetical protein